MKIGELARHTGTQVETIRYYEREGLLPEPARTEGNYRIYGDAHAERELKKLERQLRDLRDQCKDSRDASECGILNELAQRPTAKGLTGQYVTAHLRGVHKS